MRPTDPPRTAASTRILQEIEGRFGFLPPFFRPAAEQPEVLLNLWQQTLTAYVDSPLDAVFKEKVATYLGRYCAVPYCLMCHTCSLRPLGLRSDEILGLLRRPLASREEVAAALTTLDRGSPLGELPATSELESALVVLSGEVYLQGESSGAARAALRLALGLERYNLLIVFISYNKTCHQWMEAHPDVSYADDQRYLSNFDAIAQDAPEIASYFETDAPQERVSGASSALAQTVAARADEAERSLLLMQARAESVNTTMRAHADAAVREAGAGADDLQRAADFSQQLLAIVSHDLRNPLSSILVSASKIVQDVPTGPIARYAGRIVRSAERATRLVGDLLDFSQARMGGGIPLVVAPTQLDEVVRHVVDELSAAHPSRVIAVDGVAPDAGRWDADRLAQVLSNLIANALAHSPADAPVRVRTSSGATHASVEVRNANLEGPIPTSLLPGLFDPFKRGTQRSSFKSKSVGLGLFIVDHLVKRHGGEVDVRSDASGTSFIVTLPREAASP